MSYVIPLPGPHEPFTLETLDPQIWYHVYCTERHPNDAETFNTGFGESRFAPIKNASGDDVHTYYAASTIRSAMMESVLHDMPLNPPGAFQIARLVDFHLVTIEIETPLDAVSFHSLHLAKHQLSRTLLIESLPAFYPQTSQWAMAAYRQALSAAAIMYGSRRDDSGRCIMLFKDRLPNPAKPFRVLKVETLSSAVLSAQFRLLIDQLGVMQAP